MGVPKGQKHLRFIDFLEPPLPWLSMIGFVLVIVLLPDRIKLSMGWILLLFVFLEDTITIRLGSGSAITH